MNVEQIFAPTKYCYLPRCCSAPHTLWSFRTLAVAAQAVWFRADDLNNKQTAFKVRKTCAT